MNAAARRLRGSAAHPQRAVLSVLLLPALALLPAIMLSACAAGGVAVPASRSDRSWLEHVRDAVVPSALSSTYALRRHLSALPPAAGVRDGGQARSVRRASDLARLDSLYLEAVRLCDGDVHEALFALAVATLPYRRFPAVVPIIDLEMTVPVSLESVAAFEARMQALPSMLCTDTPAWGDRDKLPHFFGSAWLSLVSGAPALAVAAGDAVETLEAVFKLQGARDARDRAVNRLGVAWALRLRHQPRALPSSMFRHAHSLAGRQP